MSTTALLGMTAAAAMALSVAAGPIKAAPTQPVKNIVFVHGAFADGSSWAKVITILQAKGYNVTAGQKPLTPFAAGLPGAHPPPGPHARPALPAPPSPGGGLPTPA